MTKPIITRAHPEQVRTTQERRRSNAAGKHADRRSKRAKTRSAVKARAFKEWC